MGKKNINVRLSADSINSATRFLRDYRKRLLDANKRFVEALADQGISVAIDAVSGSGMGTYLNFYKVGKGSRQEATAIIRGTQSGNITAEWLVLDENGREVKKTAEVSPLLMAEFGSGEYADKYEGKLGSQRGTFPGQTHAFDSGGWWYKGVDKDATDDEGLPVLDGTWHRSKGVYPKMPMYLASQEIIKTVESVAREVFR